MANLMQAHEQWKSRPDDERFVSLNDLESFTRNALRGSFES